MFVITKQPETQPPPSSLELTKPVRWLPVGLLTFVLIILNTGWIANSEMHTGVTEITIATLFIGVTFMLFILTLLNQARAACLGGAEGVQPSRADADLFTPVDLQCGRRGGAYGVLYAVPHQYLLVCGPEQWMEDVLEPAASVYRPA